MHFLHAQFESRLPWFLEAVPSVACAKGGVGAYNDALQRSNATAGGVAGLDRGIVKASAFRTNYITLAKQHDFIAGMQVRQCQR